MIKKKGNKTDRTVMMENAIQKYFNDRYGIFLSSEKKLPDGHRPDLFGSLYDGNEKEIDRIIVEIKNSVPDFFSGYGLNFCVDSNYIAVPSNLVGFCIEFLRENMTFSNHIGVLEINDNGSVRTVMYPQPMNGKYSVRHHIAYFSCAHLLRS